MVCRSIAENRNFIINRYFTFTDSNKDSIQNVCLFFLKINTPMEFCGRIYFHTFDQNHKTAVLLNMPELRIKELKEQIKNFQRNIEIERRNKANHKANGSPSHYQESGKRNIKSYQKQIKRCREEIAELKKKKASSKSSNQSVFKGNILFLPFRILWWFIKLILKD